MIFSEVNLRFSLWEHNLIISAIISPSKRICPSTEFLSVCDVFFSVNDDIIIISEIYFSWAFGFSVLQQTFIWNSSFDKLSILNLNKNCFIISSIVSPSERVCPSAEFFSVCNVFLSVNYGVITVSEIYFCWSFWFSILQKVSLCWDSCLDDVSVFDLHDNSIIIVTIISPWKRICPSTEFLSIFNVFFSSNNSVIELSKIWGNWPLNKLLTLLIIIRWIRWRITVRALFSLLNKWWLNCESIVWNEEIWVDIKNFSI